MGYIYGVLPPIPPPPGRQEGVKPVKPHITIVKLGRPVKVEVRYRPFVAVLGQVDLLPSHARPRYVALRVEPYGEFAALRRLLVSSLGDAVEERHEEFRPHLTLFAVRIKRPTEEELRDAVEYARQYVGTAFEVRAIHLIDTTEGLYMPIYTVNLHA